MYFHYKKKFIKYTCFKDSKWAIIFLVLYIYINIYYIFDVAFTSFCNFIIKSVLKGVANYIVQNSIVIGRSIK